MSVRLVKSVSKEELVYLIVDNDLYPISRAELVQLRNEIGIVLNDTAYSTVDISLRNALALPVTSLEVSARSQNCLRFLGVKSVRELVKFTESQILRTSNFGRKSLYEIKEQLVVLGLHFGMMYIDETCPPLVD